MLMLFSVWVPGCNPESPKHRADSILCKSGAAMLFEVVDVVVSWSCTFDLGLCPNFAHAGCCVHHAELAVSSVSVPSSTSLSPLSSS